MPTSLPGIKPCINQTQADYQWRRYLIQFMYHQPGFSDSRSLPWTTKLLHFIIILELLVSYKWTLLRYSKLISLWKTKTLLMCSHGIPGIPLPIPSWRSSHHCLLSDSWSRRGTGLPVQSYLMGEVREESVKKRGKETFWETIHWLP